MTYPQSTPRVFLFLAVYSHWNSYNCSVHIVVFFCMSVRLQVSLSETLSAALKQEMVSFVEMTAKQKQKNYEVCDLHSCQKIQSLSSSSSFSTCRVRCLRCFRNKSLTKHSTLHCPHQTFILSSLSVNMFPPMSCLKLPPAPSPSQCYSLSYNSYQ